MQTVTTVHVRRRGHLGNPLNLAVMALLAAEGDSKIFSKSESSLRWLILFLACIMMIGNYYCYDNPAALKTQIGDEMGNPGDYETLFSLLYTVYSIPNVILPFFGGYFIDKLGVRLCIIVFATFILCGQILFAIGLSAKSWPVMFFGRVVYGFGGESLGVGNSALLAEWFTGKELAFAFGLNLSIARLGSVINNLISPQLANSSGVVFALWFGAIICGVSFACTLLITPIDRKMDAILEESEQMRKPILTDVVENTSLHNPLIDQETSMHGINSKSLPADEEEENKVEFKAVLSFSKPFWLLTISCVVVYGCVLPFNNIASSLLLERNYFIEQPNSECALDISTECESPTNQPNEFCKTSKWYQPPVAFNITDVDCDDDDPCYKDYCDLQDDAEVQATTVMSIPYIISACLSPILGGFVDRFGMRAVIATVAPAALVLVHSLLGYTKVSPIGPLVGQGLAYSGFAAVIWPSVPLTVESKYIGLAYGLVTSVQNIGLAMFPLIIAAIYSNSGDEYIPNCELFFVLLALLGFLIGLYLNYYDVNNGYIFNGTKPAEIEDDTTKLIGADANSSGRGDVVSHLRRISGDTEHLINPATGRGRSFNHSVDGHGHKQTFTNHEEEHRARVLSGEYSASLQGRSLSRG